MVSAGADPVREVRGGFMHACVALAPMRAGASLLLGCSAGGDSMALLDLCAAEAPARRWRLAVAHLDHAQRPESAEEARAVAARCAELNIPITLETLPAGAPSSEEKLRAARHEFFRRALAERGAEALLLAHQADDRAETFLMRLLAGSGPTGLASIRPVEDLGGMIVARPLLALRRSALREYLRARGLAWSDDPTNADPARKRAWVRAKILPLFNERMETDVVPRIARAAELAEEESGALAEACDLLLERMASPAPPPALERLEIGGAVLARSGAALRRRLLRQWLWRLREGPHPPLYGAFDEALKFAERGAEGAELRTIELIRLAKRGGYLVALPPGAPRLDPAEPPA